MKINASLSHTTDQYVCYIWVRGDVKHKLYIPRVDFRDYPTYRAPQQITLIKDGKYIEHMPETEFLRNENQALKKHIVDLHHKIDQIQRATQMISSVL